MRNIVICGLIGTGKLHWQKYNKIDLLNQLKYFKDISIKVYNDCKKYNYKFFEISKDK